MLNLQYSSWRRCRLSSENLKLWVLLYASSQRENGYNNLYQIWHAYSLNIIIYFKNDEVPKSMFSSSPVEVVSCNSETKHDTRKSQRINLFVSASRLQKWRSRIWQLYWVGDSVKMLGLRKIIMIISYDIQATPIEWSPLLVRNLGQQGLIRRENICTISQQ
jgi:hypothetical protein